LILGHDLDVFSLGLGVIIGLLSAAVVVLFID
jgi:hypothetical protein